MAISELRISALPYWTNTFGAKDLEEFFEVLFCCGVFLGLESAFDRPNHKKNSTGKEKIKKFFRNQLDGAIEYSKLRI